MNDCKVSLAKLRLLVFHDRLAKATPSRTQSKAVWILIVGVSTLLCKRPGLVLGWVREGRGSIPSLAQRCRRVLRFHDATRPGAGIRSAHRFVKWFKASRQ